MALVVFGEHSEEALLEDRRSKGVRQYDDTIRGIRQRLHLQQPDLVQASGEEVNSVPVVRSAFSEPFIEL